MLHWLSAVWAILWSHTALASCAFHLRVVYVTVSSDSVPVRCNARTSLLTAYLHSSSQEPSHYPTFIMLDFHVDSSNFAFGLSCRCVWGTCSSGTRRCLTGSRSQTQTGTETISKICSLKSVLQQDSVICTTTYCRKAIDWRTRSSGERIVFWRSRVQVSISPQIGSSVLKELWWLPSTQIQR
jgi:hypothetical protein